MTVRLTRSIVLLLCTLGPATDVNSQEGSAAAASAEACVGPQHRQFDFWLGNWKVYGSKGEFLGSNRIESILNGCALRESWSGKNSQGESFNIYDRTTDRWHQTWVDDTGFLLRIEGRLQSDTMVLEGQTRGRDGAAIFHRATWTPLPDGRVRQLWQTSADGKTWEQIFLGFYRRSATRSD